MTVPNEPIDKRPDGDEATEAEAAVGAEETAASLNNKEDGVFQKSGAFQGHHTTIAALQERLQAAQARADEYYDSWLRERANMENARRRAHEEVVKARKFAIESFAESLLPVHDSLTAALAQEEPTLQTLREGVDITFKQLSAAFTRHHLTEIAPTVGEKFDPHQCHALSSVASAQPENTVVQTLQKGYQIADRVLRPALVTVSSGQVAEPVS